VGTFLISLSIPTAFQTFQRTGSTGGIAVNGNGNGIIEARFIGGAWSTVANPASGGFSATLSSQSQGQGTLEARYLNDDASKVSVANVGIGDLFIVAGQSNANGQATNPQSYSHATLKATKYSRENAWADCTDPVDDSTVGAGSFMPPLATLYMASQGVPCAFVPCAVNGSVIASWSTGGTNYNALLTRFNAAGGNAKVILWWQGESDALAGTSKATYKAALNTLADALFAATGCKLLVAKLQNCSGTDVTVVNAAIVECWSENSHIIGGWDLSDIATDDGFHLKTDIKVQLAALRCWTALQAAFGWT
jgi:hypothetical protein